MLPPIPYISEFLSKQNRVLQDWMRWFQSLAAAVNQAPTSVGTVSVTAGAASVTTTPITTKPTPIAAGLYRVTYYMQVTRAASLSSSLIPTFTWTTQAVSQSVTGATMNGNTTTTFQADTLPLVVDQGSSVTYALAYSSAGGTSMTYDFALRLELVP